MSQDNVPDVFRGVWLSDDIWFDNSKGKLQFSRSRHCRSRNYTDFFPSGAFCSSSVPRIGFSTSQSSIPFCFIAFCWVQKTNITEISNFRPRDCSEGPMELCTCRCGAISRARGGGGIAWSRYGGRSALWCSIQARRPLDLHKTTVAFSMSQVC